MAQHGLRGAQGVPPLQHVPRVLPALQGRPHVQGAMGGSQLVLHAQVRGSHHLVRPADEQVRHVKLHEDRMAERRRDREPRQGLHRVNRRRPARRPREHRHRRDQLLQGPQVHARRGEPRQRQGRVGARGA